MSEYNPEELKPSKLRAALLARNSQDGSVFINRDLTLELKDGEFTIEGTRKTIEWAEMEQLQSIHDFLQKEETGNPGLMPGFDSPGHSEGDSTKEGSENENLMPG